jgi:hypothetical protein
MCPCLARALVLRPHHAQGAATDPKKTQVML